MKVLIERYTMETNNCKYDGVKASQAALVVKSPPANAGDIGDTGSIPGSGRSP